MIAHLTGRLLSKSPTLSIIDCQGVGYEVQHTPFTGEALTGETVSIHIYSHIREDAFQLFGFSNPDEKTVFKELLKINGVGPKLALSILSGIAAQELLNAISSKDHSRLQKIPGIGKKTAERLVVELADRFKDFATTMTTASPTNLSGRASELESVLLHLGYQRQEVQRAVKTLKQRSGDEFENLSLESLVKSTLRELSEAKPS